MDPERLRAGLDKLSPHLRLRVPDDLARADRYLAGTDEARAAELEAMLRDPDVRAILVARGGYGLMRIIDRIDPDVLRRDPKPIVGFSDATVLLAWAARAGVGSIHAPVVCQLGDLSDDDTARIVRLLKDPAPLGRQPWELAPIGAPRTGELRGRLVGGNLCLLSMLCGTPWQVDPTDAIVLVEEVGEKPYAIDRYLTHLHLAGGLRGAAGALLGDLVRCADEAAGFAVIDERLRSVGIAGARGAPIGHGARNAAVPWGAQVVLDDHGLEILDGAVS